MKRYTNSKAHKKDILIQVIINLQSSSLFGFLVGATVYLGSAHKASLFCSVKISLDI